MRQRRPAHRRAASEVQRRHQPLSLVRPQTASLTRSLPELRHDLTGILDAAVDAVDPARLVHAALADTTLCLPPCPCVLAAGKAAGPMFRAVVARGRLGPSVVATRLPGPAHGMTGAAVFEAGHPAPNRASLEAGEQALALARESATRGGLLVLLSGGASAMLALPAEGVSLEEKMDTAGALMAAGAAIDELNCVRKHLSRIKGGRLAAAARRTVTLALSDVHAPVADDPSVIGSGPTVPDPTTFADALDVLRSRGIGAPGAVMDHLARGARGQVQETVKPGDPRLADSVFRVIGNRHTAMEGARRAASARGYAVFCLAEATTGEAREAGRLFVEQAMRFAAGAAQPVCVLGSGETTVTVRGDGRGGRNQEFVLGAAGRVSAPGGAIGPPVVLASAGTDGIDGPTEAAGAIADSSTLERAVRHGLDPATFLASNDAYRFFEPLGDLIRWGPTGTNVGDVNVLLIG